MRMPGIYGVHATHWHTWSRALPTRPVPAPSCPPTIPPRPQGGPLFGGERLNSTDCAVAPKLYHALVALKHYKVRQYAYSTPGCSTTRQHS